MLILNNIEVIYNGVILVLKGVSLKLKSGQIISLLGANGAGKTTTLKSISGLLKTELGEVTEGSIELDGQRLDRMHPEDIVRLGIVQVMEGRKLFEHLTVEENIKVGAYFRSDKPLIMKDLKNIYVYFPKLRVMRNRVSGFLSGGERQMLVIGRAMMARPKIMLLDEPSLGLSPLMVNDIFRIIKKINIEEKTSILLVEQNAKKALSIADHGYVMETGKVVMDDSADKLKGNEDVKEFYLGLSKLGGRKNYRSVKHYKRRKRWLG